VGHMWVGTVVRGCAVRVWSHDLRVTWIKVRESCAQSSASLSRPGPSVSSGKTKSRWPEMNLDAVDGQQCPTCLTVP
jgi:hypothetical protein